MKPRKTFIAGIIPARFGSTRFPGKMLHPILGKPLIRHVWERCMKASQLESVIIATDDMRIAEVAFDFGAEVSLTKPTHQSGTDRIAEVAKNLKEATHFINIQGDEPGIDPMLINRLCRDLRNNPDRQINTAAVEIIDPAEIENPHCVKVVRARSGDALYFSRLPVPFDRDLTENTPRYLHLGIYGYRRDTLLQFVRWKPGSLEQCEKLEQLRALENGIPIRVHLTKSRSKGIDTPEDAHNFETMATGKKTHKV